MHRLFSRFLAVALLCAFAGLALAADSNSGKSKWPHVRLGGIYVGAGYSHFGGPYFGGPWGYPFGGWGASPYYSGFYDPIFYSPFFAPGYFNGFAPGPGLGEVKLKSAPKSASVFIEGGYAGSAAKLKSMWLEPGVYHLEIQDGTQTWEQKVYVLSGKSLSITPQLLSRNKEPYSKK